MGIRFFILLLASVALAAGNAHTQNPDIRKISTEEPGYSNNASQLSLRIEGGKVWINGNLMPKKDLPAGLRELDPNFYYQTAAFGIREIAFNLQGKDYLVKADKVVELPARPTAKEKGYDKGQQAAMEEYYSNLKREAPNLFYSMNREAMLTEQARGLLYQYQFAKDEDAASIRKELRSVLEQLFEINERNRELEILELQEMIDVARKEVQIRRENKSLIIDNTLKGLIGE